MKSFLKYFLYCVLSILISLYAIFLISPFVVNHFYPLNNFKADIKKIVKDSSKLDLDFSNIKIYTTPMLSFGVIIDDIRLTIPKDNSLLFSSSKIKGGLVLPSLLTLTVKTSKCKVENPYINLEIENSKQYKIVSLIEELINDSIANPKEPQVVDPKVEKLISMIRIKVPAIKIANYSVKTSDTKTNNSLKLTGETLFVGYRGTIDGKNQRAKLQTKLKLYSNENENITANINIKSNIPDTVKSNEQIEPDETIKIPFINIVDIYQKYDLHMALNANLNINSFDDIHGYFDVDNLNLKLSKLRLPDSYLHTKFFKNKVSFDSNIYAKKDEKISFLGDYIISKHPKLNIDVNSDKIYFSHLLELAEGLLDSLNIKNNIPQIATTGYILANANINTDFKKLKSNGEILISDGSFINKANNIGIKDLLLNLNFDDNQMNIKNANAKINDSNIKLTGFLDQKGNTKINASVNKLSLPILYNVFAPKEIKSAYNLNNANLDFNLDILGKLENLNVNMLAILSDLQLNDAKKTFFVKNAKSTVTLKADKTTVNALFNNNSFNFSMPSLNTKADIENINVQVDNDNILIQPFDFIYNDLSKISIKGDIKNYLKDSDINILLNGKIATQNLRQTLGNDISYYVPSKGNLPFKGIIKGNSKKQDILLQLFANNDNFISPIGLFALKSSPSCVQADIKLSGNKIKIKNSGLFKIATNPASVFENDLNKYTQNAKKLVDFAAIIDNNHINLLKISTQGDLAGKISIFNNSKFLINSKLNLKGSFDDLDILGNFRASRVAIPELALNLKNIDTNINSNSIKLNLAGIDLNGSVIDTSLNIPLSQLLKGSNIIQIRDINVKSNYIDLDKALVVLDKLNSYMPPVQNTASKQVSSQTTDIPIYAIGAFKINKFKTGEIVADNIKGNIEVKKNNLFVEKLSLDAFKGKISGVAKVDLISGLISFKMKGSDIDSDIMMQKAANMKDTLSGILSFDTQLQLAGQTYEEQMKSLKGFVNFEVKDGQYGPFSKLENFFLAENIRENPIFKNTIGAILTPLTTIDSSHFENLSGTLDFNNGIVKLNPIKSQGDVLCVLIKGEMNLLTNNLDTFARIRLASAVSDLLGPISLANPVNLVKNTPGLNLATVNLFSVFTQLVQENDYKEIPEFSKKHSDNNATKFQIVLKGDVAKPLKLVKSFKWLALKEDIDKANEFKTNYIKEQQELARQELMNKLQSEYEENNKLKVGVEKVLNIDTTAPKVKQMIVDEIVQKSNDVKTKQEELSQKQTEVKNKTIETIQNKTSDTQKKVSDFEIKIQNNIKDKIQSKIPTSSTNKETDPEYVEN